MKGSQNTLSQVKIMKCGNPNCKSAFLKYENCSSCNSTFCTSCLGLCDSCGIRICKFCIRINYNKFMDQQICPNC